MTTRKTHKPDNPEQSKRFIDMAREVGVDERQEVFDQAFDRVIHPQPEALRSNAPRIEKKSNKNI
jgi:hypothetical protein